MQESKKFNQKEYKAKWEKEHPRVKITINLKSNEEKEEIEKIAKKFNLKYNDIFRIGIKELKKK